MQITEDLLFPKNNCCVYLHRRADDNEVFYIGSGTQGKRENHFSNRSKAWQEVKQKHGVIVEIYRKDLDLTSARQLEYQLVNYGNYPFLVNSRPVIKQNTLISKSDIEDFIYYDETSPTCLRWKICGGRRKINKPVGSFIFDKQGKPLCVTARINEKTTRVSRFIWVLFNDYLPDNMVIDHIDNNPHNNKISNLRCITSAENSRNRKISKSSKTGFSGVFRTKAGYLASVHIGQKTVTSHYAISIYGEEVALNKALSWRKTMILKLNEHGANYSDNHIPDIEHFNDYERVYNSFTGIERIHVNKNKDGEVISFNVMTKYKGVEKSKLFTVSKHGYDKALQLAKDFAQKVTYCDEDFVHGSYLPIKLVYVETGEELGTYQTIVQAANITGISIDKLGKRTAGATLSNLFHEGREIKVIRLSDK